MPSFEGIRKKAVQEASDIKGKKGIYQQKFDRVCDDDIPLKPPAQRAVGKNDIPPPGEFFLVDQFQRNSP
ncbi:hypothetical protein GCM10028804_29880 [Larkinella terrae]